MGLTREKIATTLTQLGIEPHELTQQDAQILGVPNHRQLPPSPQSIFSNPELQAGLNTDFIKFLLSAIEAKLIPNPQNISPQDASSHQLRDIHLNALNDPLENAGLPRAFTHDQFRMGGKDAPVLLSTDNVQPLGDGYSMVDFTWSTGVNEKEIKVGRFKVIAPDSSRIETEGAFQLCITDRQDFAGSKSIAKGNIFIDQEELDQINKYRQDLNLPLFPNQKKDQKNSPRLQNIVTNDQNKFYYVPQVFIDEHGRENIVFSNTLKNGSAGSVGLIIYPDGTIGFIYNSRPLQNRPIELELPRGFPNLMVSELEAETGLKPEWITQSYPVIQGHHDHTHPDVQILRLDEFVGMSVPEIYRLPEETPGKHITNQQLTEFEAISHLILTPKEVLEKIKNGAIRDAFTLSTISKYLVDEKAIILNPVYRNRGLNILMEIRYFPQLGKYLPVVPEGSKESGTRVGEVLPNSGMIVGGSDIASVGLKDIDKSHGYFVQFPLEKIIKLITNPDACDMVTRATLFTGLYNQSILIEPERMAVHVSRRKK